MTAKKSKAWWSEGVRFECQGSGKCCTSHGEFGYVFLTREDRTRLARHLGVTSSEFIRQYCEGRDGVYHLKENPSQPDCMFLKHRRCSVYEARPTQCRTWPFWPEVMSAKKWRRDVAEFCPGVGKGPVISAATIQSALNEQIHAELEY